MAKKISIGKAAKKIAASEKRVLKGLCNVLDLDYCQRRVVIKFVHEVEGAALLAGGTKLLTKGTKAVIKAAANGVKNVRKNENPKKKSKNVNDMNETAENVSDVTRFSELRDKLFFTAVEKVEESAGRELSTEEKTQIDEYICVILNNSNPGMDFDELLHDVLWGIRIDRADNKDVPDTKDVKAEEVDEADNKDVPDTKDVKKVNKK